MIKQCKGKDLSNVPASKLYLGETYFGAIKYDGNYVQIHKKLDKVEFYTSGDKQFYHSIVASYLLEKYPEEEFILECEYIADSAGKLGDRTKAAKLTTYRTNYSKNLQNSIKDEASDTFKIFDIILFGVPFEHRFEWLTKFKLSENINVVFFELGDLAKFQVRAKELVKGGYEGMFIKSVNHMYLPGKRVNNAIKLKYRPTVDLKCVDVVAGEGKYAEMIGSLVLEDAIGRRVSVGSGLDDTDRGYSADWFLGKVIEIEYEQIIDTYIQPVYVRIRHDKAITEID